MKKLIRKLSVLTAVAVAVTFSPVRTLPALSVQADEVQVQAEEGTVYNSVDEAAAYVRQQMVAREENIEIMIGSSLVPSYDANILNDIAGNIASKAIEYKRGAFGYEGDALASNRNGLGYRISSSSSGIYTISYTIKYLTTKEQENELTTAVNNAIAGLNLEGKSTYEKIKSIYDYICDNVDYDYDGLADSNNSIKYTAYSALINRKAVCEGYAVLFYRMCMDAGIPARIITGQGNGGAHAWNIVEINGYYYNVDVTWDGQDSETRHNYFLKNEADFADHTRDAAYSTAEFNAAFPMSASSYMDYGSLDEGVDGLNWGYSFTSIDGKEVSVTVADKPKVLVFFSSNCTNSGGTISSIKGSNFNDVDILYLNVLQSGNEAATRSFREQYGNESMDFCAYTEQNGYAMTYYAYNMPGYTSGDISLPMIVYIDKDNKIQMVTSGYSGAGTIRNYVNYYCKNMTDSVEHNHIYSDSWLSDANNHWHDCLAEGCDGSVSSKAAHTAGDWIVDKEATSSEDGSRHKECTVCGYIIETESIEKPSEPESTTEAPTEPESTTEAPTEPESTTEAPTEPESTTEAPTEPESTTEAPTEPATPAPTEPATPAPTEPESTTEAPTEPATPAPTEKPSEAESTTEAPTEPSTEAPTQPSKPEKPVDSGIIEGINNGDKVVNGAAESGSGTVVPRNYISAAIENDAQIVIDVKGENGETLVKYTIDGSKFTQAPDDDFKLDATFGEKNELTDNVKEQLNTMDSSIFLCSFEHSGELNGELAVTVYTQYESGTELKLFYYNPATGKAEDVGQTVLVAEDGSTTFLVTHFSSYLLVKADDIKNDVAPGENETTTGETETTQPETTTGTPETTQPETSKSESDADEQENDIYVSPSTGAGASAAGLIGAMFMAFGAAGVCLSRKKKH